MRAVTAWLCLSLLLAAPAAAQELRVALGVQDTAAPGKSGQSGGLANFNEEVAREICRRLVVRCATVNVLFGEILPGVESGKYDLGFGNYLRTPEREKRVAFSETLWRSSSRLVTSADTVRRLAGKAGGDLTLDSLREARVVAIEDSQQAKYLQSIAVDRKLQVVAAKSMTEAMQQLRSGQAEFALLPMLSAYALLSREGLGQFEFIGPPVTAHNLGGTVHIALPKDNDNLRLSVDRAIAAIRADGSYHRITRQYFPFSLD